MNDTDRPGYVVDRQQMHRRFPTHLCPAEFWEELGRTIAAFGFLEDCLKRANLAITATRTYGSVDEAQKAFHQWETDLKRSLDETLGVLAERFVDALSDDDRFRQEYVSGLKEKLERVAQDRNALCHGAWTDYDAGTGSATLRHWPRKGWREHTERPMSREDLAAMGRDSVDIAIRVIDAVTSNGIRFPGSDSPGTELAPGTTE